MKIITKDEAIKCLKFAFAWSVLTFINWVITCFGLKLISICFGITYNLKIATGIWIGLMIIRATFKQEKEETW